MAKGNAQKMARLGAKNAKLRKKVAKARKLRDWIKDIEEVSSVERALDRRENARFRETTALLEEIRNESRTQRLCMLILVVLAVILAVALAIWKFQ